MVSNKDWTGNKPSTFVCNGATGHALGEREQHDYYATDPKAAEFLLKLEPQLNNIWENAAGEGHLASVFDEANKLAMATDLIDRDYKSEKPKVLCGKLDFFKVNKNWAGDIVTNPPYKYAQEWVEHSLALMSDGRYLCLFLKLTFLEGKARRELFEKNPPIRVWVSSSRIKCAKNGDFKAYDSSATAYAWFIWQKGYKGETVVKWFN